MYRLHFLFTDGQISVRLQALDGERNSPLESIGLGRAQLSELAGKYDLIFDESSYFPDPRHFNVDVLFDYSDWNGSCFSDKEEQIQFLDFLSDRLVPFLAEIARKGVIVLLSVSARRASLEVLEAIRNSGLMEDVFSYLFEALSSSEPQSFSENPLLVFRGRVFELSFRGTAAEMDLPSALSESALHSLRALGRGMIARFEEGLERAIQDARDYQRIALPQFPERATVLRKEGVTVGRLGRLSEWEILLDGFSYAPRFLAKNREIYELSAEMQGKLAREVILRLTVGRDGVVESVTLRKKEPELGRFFHYHSVSDYDCLGDFEPGLVTNLDQALRLKRELEELFETINLNSIGSEYPPDLPSIDELEEDTVEGREVEVWTT